MHTYKSIQCQQFGNEKRIIFRFSNLNLLMYLNYFHKHTHFTSTALNFLFSTFVATFLVYIHNIFQVQRSIRVLQFPLLCFHYFVENRPR